MGAGARAAGAAALLAVLLGGGGAALLSAADTAGQRAASRRRPPLRACPQGQISMLGGWMDRILGAEDWARVSKQRAHGSRCVGGRGGAGGALAGAGRPWLHLT